MDKVIKKKKYGSWIGAVAISAALLMVILTVCDVMYETNDDFQVAKEIAEGYPFVGFVNYYMCRALIVVQKLLPNYNMFVVSQMVFSFISFVVVLKILICRCDSKYEIVLAAVVCALLGLDHFSCIQFTKTAGLLMIVGLICLADNYTHERRVLPFIMGSLLYITGAAYRQKVMLPTIAFLVCYLAIWTVMKRGNIFAKEKKLSEVTLAVFIIVVALIPYVNDYISDNKNMDTPELRNARIYQAQRTSVTDYPLLSLYDNQDDIKKEYAEAGFSRNDLHLVTHFVLDYDGAASIENLKIINEINAPHVKESKSITKAIKKALRGALSSIIEISFTGIHILLCFFLAALIFVKNKKRSSLYTIAIAFVSIIMYSAVYYIQRPQYRALYVVDASAILWLLYISSSEERKTETKQIAALLIIFSVMAAMLFGSGLRILEAHNKYNKAITEDKEFEDYLRKNDDKFFVVLETTMGQPNSYLTPLLCPTYPRNLSGTGGWETLSPYKMIQLNEYGIDNPIRDLINNKGAYILGDHKIDKLTEYYNKWYCESDEIIELVKVNEYEEEGIYQVVRHRIQ